jgi:hypothetical protein
MMDTLWSFEMSDHEDDTSEGDEDCNCEQCGDECPTRHILVSDMHKHCPDELGNVRDFAICFCSYNCLLKWAKASKDKYE